MPTPLQGAIGQITWGGTNLVWAGDWEYNLTNNTEEIGPHIGDATIYEVNTSQQHEFTIKGTVPSGGDPGLNALIAAAAARTTAALVLEQELGKRVSFSAATLKSLKLATAANGTQTYEISGGNGAGTVTLAQDT